MRFDLKVFLDKWCVFDGNKTTIIDGDLKSTDHYAVTKDYIRSTVFIAVRSLEHEFKAKRKLTYTHHPTAVYAACAVDRTELKLAPLTSLQNISVGDDAKGPIKVSCKGWDKGIFLTGTPKAPHRRAFSDARAGRSSNDPTASNFFKKDANSPGAA